MMQHVLVIHRVFICIQLYAVIVKSQEILKHEYHIGQSKGQCPADLIDGEDSIVFRSLVNFKGSNSEWGRNVVFVMSTRNENITYMVNLKHGCRRDSLNEECFCEYEMNGVYTITCNIKAKVQYSHAEFRVRLSHLNGHRKESIVLVPKVYDRSSFYIHANERNLSNVDCWFNISHVDPAIRACFENAPPTCTVSIFSLGNLIATGNMCAHASKEDIDTRVTLYTIEYSVCGRRAACICQAKFVNVKSANGKSRLTEHTTLVYVIIVHIIWCSLKR